MQEAQGESAKLEMGVLEARQEVGKQGALVRQQQAALRKQEQQLGEERAARQRQSDELRALHGHVEHLQNQARLMHGLGSQPARGAEQHTRNSLALASERDALLCLAAGLKAMGSHLGCKATVVTPSCVGMHPPNKTLLQVHIGEQRLQDCERLLQQAHSAAQALAADKGDLHSQLASLEQELQEKAALGDHCAELEAQVSTQIFCQALSWSGK